MKEQQKHLQLPEQPNKYDLNHQVTNQFYAMASSFPPPDSNIGAITFDTGNQFNQRMTQQQQQNSHMPGSAEHTRLKKETHREVERRRRETINNGIQQLSDLIPGGEKNKGRIIMRAIQYIHELKASEASNIEKFTLEKMIFERAVQEYSVQVEQLKQENQKLRMQLSSREDQLGKPPGKRN